MLRNVIFALLMCVLLSPSAVLANDDQPGLEVVYGPTSDNDNLWQVANIYSPAPGDMIGRTAVAIFQLNPNAFNAKNINGLMSGYMLLIPSNENIESVSPGYAYDFVRKQNKQWRSLQVQTIASSSDSGDDENLQQTLALENQRLDVEMQNYKMQREQQEAKIASLSDELETLAHRDAVRSSDITDLAEENLKLGAVVNDQQLVIEKLSNKNNFTSSKEEETKHIIEIMHKRQLWLSAGIILFGILFFSGLVSFVRARSRGGDDIVEPQLEPQSVEDFHGDEMIDTQLDLANAYIELNKFTEAKSLIKAVFDHGDEEQSNQAQQLLKKLKSRLGSK
jgi:FimV-like protein